MTALTPWNDLPDEIRATLVSVGVKPDKSFVFPRRARLHDALLRQEFLALLRTYGKKTAAYRALHEKYGLSERQLYRRLQGYAEVSQ